MFINLHTHLHRLPHSLLVKTSFHAVASRFPLEALPHADDVDDDDDNDVTAQVEHAEQEAGIVGAGSGRVSREKATYCIHRRQEKC